METTSPHGPLGMHAGLFTLPMRDGNTFIFYWLTRIHATFYASYEGWKPKLAAFFVVMLPTFYASYEGWKHKKEDPQNLKSKAFYASYEGWKHSLLQVRWL